MRRTYRDSHRAITGHPSSANLRGSLHIHYRTTPSFHMEARKDYPRCNNYIVKRALGVKTTRPPPVCGGKDRKKSLRRRTIRPKDFSDNFPHQFPVLRWSSSNLCVTVRHDEFRPTFPNLPRDSVTNPRRLWLSEGVWADAQRDIRSFEPLADIVMESELDQADWIHRWDERGNLPNRMFPNLIKLISCCN